MNNTSELLQSCLETQGGQQLVANIFSPFVYTKESSNKQIKPKNAYPLNARVQLGIGSNNNNNKSAPRNKDITSMKSKEEMQFPHFFRAIGPTKQAIPLKSLLNIRVQGSNGDEQEGIKQQPQEPSSLLQKKTEKNTHKIHEMITVNQAKRFQKVDSNRPSIDIDSDAQMQLLLFPHSPSSFSSAIPYTITPKNIQKVTTNNFFPTSAATSQHRPLSGQTKSQKNHVKSSVFEHAQLQQQQQPIFFPQESYTQRQVYANKNTNESNDEKLLNQQNGQFPFSVTTTAPKQGVSYVKTERHTNIGVLTPTTAPIYSSKRILSAASLTSPPVQHSSNISNFAISQFSPEIEITSPATSPRSFDMEPKGFSSLKGLFFSPSKKNLVKLKPSGVSSTSSTIIERLLSSERQNDSALSKNFDLNNGSAQVGGLLTETAKLRQDYRSTSREEALKKHFMRKVMEGEDGNDHKQQSNHNNKIKDIFTIEKGTQFNADISPETHHPSVILKHKKSFTGILLPQRKHVGSIKTNQLFLASNTTPTDQKIAAPASMQLSSTKNDSVTVITNQKSHKKSSNVQIIYPPSMFTTQGYLPSNHRYETTKQEKSQLYSKQQFKEDTDHLFLKNISETTSKIVKDKQISLPLSPRNQIASSKTSVKLAVSPRQIVATLNKTNSQVVSAQSSNSPSKVVASSNCQSTQRAKQGSKLTNETEEIKISETNNQSLQEHLPKKQQLPQSNLTNTIQSVIPGVDSDIIQTVPHKNAYYFHSKISQQEEVSDNLLIYKYTSKSQRVPTSHLEQAATNESYNSKGIIFNKEQRSIGSFKSWDNLEQEDVVENIVGDS